MAIIQPKRRSSSGVYKFSKENGNTFEGKSKEFSDSLPATYDPDFDEGFRVLSFSVNEVSNSVMFYFNALEDVNSISSENAAGGNYLKWTGNYVGDIPMKNQAWQSTREVTDLIKQTAATAQELGLETGAEYVEKFANLVQRKYKRTSNAIHILVPDSVQFSSGAGWQDVNFDLNAFGLFVDVATNDQTKALGILQRESAEALDSFGEGGRISDAMMKSIKNPYTQQAFQGMNRRTFQFNWQFAPKSQDELNVIDEIIALFRFHMHPSISNLSGTGSNYLNSPGQVDIEWYFKDPDNGEWSENAWIPKISTCVIESVSTDYTPNGQFSFFRSAGAPTQINFSIQLKETTPITKNDISRGF